MGSAQSSLPSFIFPEMSESDLKSFVNSLNSDALELKYERTLGKGRVSWSMLVRSISKSLLLMRLYAKRSSSRLSTVSKRRSASSMPTAVDPLSATKLSFIHELYYEKCVQFDFVLKPLLINDCDDFLVMVRSFARYNLPDRLITESLSEQEKFWIARQLIEAFLKLHQLRAFHGDFGSGKVFLTSDYKVLIGDFAPIKPFSLQSRTQNPIEFYQIWFDEGLDGEFDEIGRGCYLAPERLKFNSVENFEAADLFSLGCVLVELFSSRAFLQFKDVLSLGNAKDPEEYDELLSGFIKKANMSNSQILNPLVKRLCAFDPKDRKLTQDDLMEIQSKIDPLMSSWRTLISAYRFSNDYNKKIELIAKFPDQIENFDNLLLLTLKEKDPILSALLVDFILQSAVENRNELVKVFIGNWRNNLFVNNIVKEFLMVKAPNCCTVKEFPLIQAFNSGLRDNFFKELSNSNCNLKEVVELVSIRLKGEKLMSVLNKLLQIYRKRDVYDYEFESRITFEYLAIDASEEEMKILYKTCWKFHEKYVAINDFSQARIAFQLDLEKNKVPIESSRKSKQSRSSWLMKRSSSSSSIISRLYPRLKQRALNGPVKWTEAISGILQSPDRTFIIGYTETTLHFWDFKGIIRTGDGEPLASVNPRADAVIYSVIFGREPDSLIISFKDGIIGLYKIVGSAKEFNIKESFGPFESGNLKLLMTRTFQNDSVLLVVGKQKIYGIFPSDGEIVFEFSPQDTEISHVIDLVDGCLICLDTHGQFKLIEIFYETGQVLATWQLDCSPEWEIEAASVRVNASKINLFVKMKSKIGRVILVYHLDPLCEIVTCTFRHWALNSNQNDKTLPSIKCKRVFSTSDTTSITIRSNFGSLIGLDQEIVDCSDGILRLIDFTCISPTNSTSILHPLSFKPSLKLRNKKGQIPEIVEKTGDMAVNFANGTVEKLLTFDGKNLLIITIINNEILFYY